MNYEIELAERITKLFRELHPSMKWLEENDMMKYSGALWMSKEIGIIIFNYIQELNQKPMIDPKELRIKLSKHLTSTEEFRKWMDDVTK